MKKVDFNKLQAGDLVQVPRTQFAPMRSGWNGWLFSEAVVIRKGVGRKSKRNVVVVEMRTPAGKNNYGTIRKRVQAMAADTTTLTKKMRAALRISSTSEKITEEINDCIAACKMDLQDVGVKKLDETDALIIRAITLYCKAEFGYSDKSEQFWKSYECLKTHLSLSSEYTGGETPDSTDDEVNEEDIKNLFG